uniref:Kunitz-type trypsin inhibitor alpha chain (Fragments) n=1 Tax=Albizia kalkora TaxID=199156 RepID=ITRA_ALBKA|nr:RecName: Full=Kunitz-type trypsin inhibitor alpha chain; AltName: Full=AKTI [Albizia kalkora]
KELLDADGDILRNGGPAYPGLMPGVERDLPASGWGLPRRTGDESCPLNVKAVR